MKKFLKTSAKDAPNYPWQPAQNKIMHKIHFFLQKTWTLGQNGRIGKGIRAVFGFPLYPSKEVVFRAFPGAIAI